MSNFVHLHVHTQYSILDGAADIDELFDKAKEYGMGAVAITDHGNMFGVKQFFDTAKKKGLKPILGIETYVARNSRHDRSDKEDRAGDHLILLAKNKTGYHNLVKLSSLAYTEGFYYKPRIDKELLEKYSEGLIVSTACLGGEIPQAIMAGKIDEAEKLVEWFKAHFGNDFYLEVMRHKSGNPKIDSEVFQNQQMVNKAMLQLSEKFGVKIIATNDVHFLNAEDAEAHDRLICLNTRKDLDDPNRMRYTTQEFFKTPSEMMALFPDMPEALANTVEISNKIEAYELDTQAILPKFPLPDGFDNENDYLEHITYQGAAERYGEITDDIKERIDFELGVIKKMGFPGYFLIVWDFIKAAREMGVLVGPGRGSAAGSVVAYSTKITNIDPLKYDLLFERFLNPDRISMPDIDIDFDDEGRDRVLEWVVNKYGYNRVAHIVTFGTMAAKSAIKDVARVHKLPIPDANYLAKMVPEGPKVTLKKAFAEVPELKALRTGNDENISSILKFAERLEGSVRQSGIHACGVIIGRDDLIEHIPICTNSEAKLLVTQYDGHYVEPVGMLKMDFLGLRTLSIIRSALENIELSKGIKIDIEQIPLDDAKTFELYGRGETTALFQFESPGMKKHLKALQPNRFEDLVAMNALYRPGPMAYIPSFIARKHGKEKIEYDHPIMEPYLKNTYGVTVYQEQVMLLSRALANFTRGDSDKLRKAMGKKIMAVMNELKVKFADGCKNNPVFMEGCTSLGKDPDKLIDKIWTDWEAFAEYAFNKSHSVCYAYLSYQTAYLKAHHPAEFMAAVLSNNITDIKKISDFMDECRRMGLNVFGPDVNESYLKFMVNKKGDIRFGLGAVKGVGEGAVLSIVAERRKNGEYKSIFDFVERVDLRTVNKRTLEAMAMAGALDCFTELRRSQYFAPDKEGTFIETILKFGSRVQLDKANVQVSLFGDAGSIEITKPPIPTCPDWDKLEKLNKERDLVGIYLSEHPLDEYKVEIEHFCNHHLADLNNLEDLESNIEISVAGLVSKTKTAVSKNGNQYGVITLEDYSGTYNFNLFSKDFDTYRRFMQEGQILLVKGKVQQRQYSDTDQLEYKITSMHLLSEARDKLIKNLQLTIPLHILDEEMVEQLFLLAENNKGNVLLNFVVADYEESVSVQLLSRSHKVRISEQLIEFFNANPEIEFKFS